MREINGDAAGQPLMQGDESPQHAQEFGHDIDERDDSEVLEESALQTPTPFIWALTLAAGVSGLLFGYEYALPYSPFLLLPYTKPQTLLRIEQSESQTCSQADSSKRSTGVISSTLVSINADLSARPLTTLDKSLITSCTSLAALIASPLTGVLADRFGRRRVILAADVLFVGGAAWQALTTSVWGMVGGRSIVGLGIGGASMVVPLYVLFSCCSNSFPPTKPKPPGLTQPNPPRYISESSPSPFRGRLVTVSSLLITGGQVVAYVIGYLFSSTPGGWRWMVGLGALPAVLQIAMLGFMPESPRWLVKAGRADEGRRVLGRIYGDGDRDGRMKRLVEGVVRRVEREILEEEEGGQRRDEEGVERQTRTPWVRIQGAGWCRGELEGIGHRVHVAGVSATVRFCELPLSSPFFPFLLSNLHCPAAPRRILLHAPSFASFILPKLVSSATANSGT